MIKRDGCLREHIQDYMLDDAIQDYIDLNATQRHRKEGHMVEE